MLFRSRFMWGAEHYGITNHFHAHMADLDHVLAMINVDMIGFNQQTARAMLHLTRSPDSNPSFLDDVVQAFLEQVGHENTISLRNEDVTATDASEGYFDPIFAPTGSHEPLHYNVERFWGPSDHEEAQALRVRAIMLNDFPDVFISTQEDSVAAGDPTQMRRGVVLTAASAYYLAAVSSSDTAKLLRNALEKAQKRLADDEEHAYQLLDTSQQDAAVPSREDAENIVKRAFAREATSLSSLSELVGSAEFGRQLAPFSRWLADAQRSALARVDDYATLHHVTASPGHKSRDTEGAALIPVRTCVALGPVSVFRQEYGRWWLIEKTGDEHFVARFLSFTLSFVEPIILSGRFVFRLLLWFLLIPKKDKEGKRKLIKDWYQLHDQLLQNSREIPDDFEVCSVLLEPGQVL